MTQLRSYTNSEVALTYWVLRYVPDPVREEFVNVGVVVGGAGQDWAIRRIHELGRVNRIDGDPTEASNWLLRLEHLIGPASNSDLGLLEPTRHRLFAADESFMDRLRRQQENNFQISEPRPVVAPSAEDAADRLYELLVLAPAERLRSSARNQAVRSLREEVHTHMSRKAYQPNVKLLAGPHKTRMEFAFGRSDVVQLTQVVAFDIRSTDHLASSIQSSSYVLTRLRRDGAILRNPQRKKQNDQPVRRDVALRVLYVPPVSPAQEEVYGMAVDAWNHLDVHAVPVGQELALVNEANELIGD